MVGGEAEMREVAEHCEEIGAGIGGPDNTLDGSGSSSYPIIRDMKGKLPLAIASQTRSYTSGFTARQLVDYAVDDLAVNFAVWLRYTGGTMTIDDIIAEIGRQEGRINSIVPANLQPMGTQTVLSANYVVAKEHRPVVPFAHSGSRAQLPRFGHLDLTGRRGTAGDTRPKRIVLFPAGQ